jgi:hypothetical protein
LPSRRHYARQQAAADYRCRLLRFLSTMLFHYTFDYLYLPT